MRLQGLNNSEICIWKEKELILLETVNEDNEGNIIDVCYMELSKELAQKLHDKLGVILNN